MTEFFGTESVVVPDLPAPIVAYRAWSVGEDGELIGYGGPWNEDGSLVADCHADPYAEWRRDREWRLQFSSWRVTTDEPPAPSPCVETPCADDRYHPGYGCGIYGFNSLEQLAAHGSFGAELVWGTVELGGLVREHTHGYRASHGQVTGIYRAPNSVAARKVAALYDVPLLPLPLTQAEIDGLRRPAPESPAPEPQAERSIGEVTVGEAIAVPGKALRRPINRVRLGAALIAAYFLLFAAGLPVVLLWPLSLVGGVLVGTGTSALYFDRKAARRG